MRFFRRLAYTIQLEVMNCCWLIIISLYLPKSDHIKQCLLYLIAVTLATIEFDFFRLLVRHHQRHHCYIGDRHPRHLVCSSHHEKISSAVHTKVIPSFIIDSKAIASFLIIKFCYLLIAYAVISSSVIFLVDSKVMASFFIYLVHSKIKPNCKF
jgi:hypothetical protein